MRLGPREASAQERSDHNLTHLPIRNWRRRCVRGRGKEESCSRKGGEAETPDIIPDFMLMGEEGGKTITMLVARGGGGWGEGCGVLHGATSRPAS